MTAASERELPITRRILHSQLKQLGHTGLFLAFTGKLEEGIARLRPFYDVLAEELDVIQSLGSEPRPRNVPVIYNPTTWTSTRLCGYTGTDLDLTAREVVASYFETWSNTSRFPKAATGHFIKCALWYSATHDQDPLVGLSLLIDLFDNGFIASTEVFTNSLDGYIRQYTVDNDLSFMKGTTLLDVSLINEKLSQYKESQLGVRSDPERLESLVAGIIEFTMERVDLARQAQSLDEWLIREASLRGPVLWLATFHNLAEEFGFGVLPRTMISYMEEMSADIHASQGWQSLQAQHELAPAWDIRSFQSIADGYRERYPDDSWLDQMTTDRLLFPDCVREMIRPAGVAAFMEQKLPPEWRLPSEKLAFPLCIAYGRHASLVRAWDFSPQAIAEEIGDMGLPPNQGETKIAARRQLLHREVAMLTNEVFGFSGLNPVQEARLEKLRALFPWNPDLCRFAAIMIGLRGDNKTALTSFLHCILIEPDNDLHWLGIARFAELSGSPEDAAALWEIARRVKALTGASP